MNEKQPKTYVPKASAKEHTFPDGRKLMKLSFDAQTLAEFARQNKNDSGYLNLCVSARREPGRYGETHSIWLDTWRPDPSKRSAPRGSDADEPNPHQLGATRVEHDESEPPF